MEYGGKAMRPRLVKEGKREMISGGQMLQRLRKQLLEAINMEDYSTAAQVRDFISIVVRQDPVLSARQALQRAVSEERYDDAAKLRDELKDMIPPEKDNQFVLGNLDNSSNTCTKDIRVRVKSGYVVERSNPSRQQYFFAYRIRISNEGTRTVQLVNRHWTITDATGRTDEVRGPGVIGEQPVLRAGNEFEYTSACPLRTPAGKMEGEYQMIHVDSDDPAPFAVAIGPFALRVEDDEEEGVAFQ
jgi:ApaG protein